MKPPGFDTRCITFDEELRRRILVLDGAMGTVVRHRLIQAGGHAADQGMVGGECKCCCDLLCLTRPGMIGQIHRDYIEAGADIITTNTFNANAVSLCDTAAAPLVRDINLAGARLARQEVERAWRDNQRRVYVAGGMGPTSVLLSRAAGSEAVEAVEEAYCRQAEALIEGGVDALLVETIIDSLNARAAIAGIHRAFAVAGRSVPLMLSASPDKEGRLLSGETIVEFAASVSDAGVLSIGLNCGYGAGHLAGLAGELQSLPCHVSLHPNAGLPDAEGRYPLSPQMMAAALAPLMRQGKLNIAGGCCGTTPQHIRALAALAAVLPPRRTIPRDVRY